MIQLKYDFCGKLIFLRTSMPPTPNISISGFCGMYDYRYDICLTCAIKILGAIGMSNDAKDLEKRAFKEFRI
jgi:hypothetical protein